MDVVVTQPPGNLLELFDSNVNFSHLIQEYRVKIFKQTDDIYDIINSILERNVSEEAFYIVDLGKIIRQYQRWKEILPDIEPYYAIKANANPLIIRVLASMGCNFDCASKNEIASVISITSDPARIIYANPVKMSEQIRYSRANDVDLMTFDSVTELYKIKLYHPYASLVMRLKVDDSNSMCKLSSKFGCDQEEAAELFSVAKALKLSIVGVSFHVGSGCMDAEQYRTAIQGARTIFDIAIEHYGLPLTLLDIGGGFSDSKNPKYPKFEELAEVIKATIKDEFADVPDLRVIAEPGRFFVTNSHTLVLSVIGKKERLIDGKRGFMYYLSDGVYGSFNNIFFDYAVRPELIPFNERDGQTYPSQVWGPTCDSMDCIRTDVELPELCVGEYLYTEAMGAYTQSTATGSYESAGFNGFKIAHNIYILTC